MVSFVIENGTGLPAPGGAEKYILTREDLAGLAAHLEEQTRLARSAKGIAVVLGADGNVITNYHLY